MQFKIIPVLLLFFIVTIETKCHYSCNNCTEQFYTSCTSCPNNSNFTYVLSLNPDLGTCAQIPEGQANILGVLLLISTICILPMFLQQQMVQLILFIQTLGLCFLVQIYYNPILDYTLTGCSYLMIISPMTHGLKTVPLGVNIDILKGRVFFSSFSFRSNIIGIGSINLLIFVTLVLLPIFKNIRKKCVDQRVQFCPDWLIQKVQLAFSIAFVFFIQETTSVIYFSLKYDEFSVGQILITILYFIILIAFSVNQFLYPLAIFRSKAVQTITIIGKTVTPMFLLSSADQHFIYFPLVITFSIVITIATNKNRNKGSINRLLFYHIIGIVVLFLLTCYYIIQKVSNNAQTSKQLAIACFVGLFGVFSCVILELIIRIKQRFCKNTTLQSRQTNRDITMQAIEVCYQKQQKTRNLSQSLCLQEHKQDSSPKKRMSKDGSVIPEVSEQYLPQIERSSNPSLGEQSRNTKKQQNSDIEPKITLKKDQTLQFFQEVQYAAYMPTDKEKTINQITELNQLENGSSIMVNSESKNKRRLAKLRREKKS